MEEFDESKRKNKKKKITIALVLVLVVVIVVGTSYALWQLTSPKVEPMLLLLGV